MKTKIKRHSRSVLSVVLAVCMLLSCVAVGIIATNAAYIGGSSKAADNVKANTADVANSADDAVDTENAAVGAKAPEAVGAKAPEAVGWDTEKTGVHYKLGTGNYTDSMANASGLAQITVDSSTTITYSLRADYGGKERWYKKNSSIGNPSAASSQTDNWFAKYERASSDSGTAEFSVSVTAGTYNFQFDTIEQNGDQLKYHFWKTVTSYDISYGSVSGGSFASNNPTSANSGSSVSVTVQPDPGYQLDTFTVTNSSNNQSVGTSGSGNTRNFTMPSANVTVSATFSQINYTVETGTLTHCSITSLSAATAHYGDTITFNVNPETNYAIQSVKFTPDGGSAQDCTPGTGNQYSFTMPAANVTISAVCVTTSGTATVYFKSASAWVYHPFIKVGNSEEIEMTVDRELTNSTNGWKAKSKTGSLKYYWYRANLTGIDATRATTLSIRLQDTFVDITDSFNISDGASLYLACDDLMYGNELVDLSSYNVTGNANKLSVLDFYDTPLHMVANATDIASLDP